MTLYDLVEHLVIEGREVKVEGWTDNGDELWSAVWTYEFNYSDPAFCDDKACELFSGFDDDGLERFFDLEVRGLYAEKFTEPDGTRTSRLVIEVEMED